MRRYMDSRMFAVLGTLLIGVVAAMPVLSDPVQWRVKDGETGHWYEGVVVTLEAEADAYIRTDLDIRRNDNYGCERSIAVGSSRGGGGIPYGEPDAMRALVRFDLSGIDAELAGLCRDATGRISTRLRREDGQRGKCGLAELGMESAVLELTLLQAPSTFDQGMPDSLYQIDVHRIVDPGPLTPFVTWVEGNGREAPPPTPEGSGCEYTDPGFGVAWVGAGDGGDPDNQSQPDFDPEVIASATIDQATHVGGDVIRWDVTALVLDWLTGSVPNHGMLLRDVTSDGSFRGVRFGAREGTIFGIYPDVVEGPRLVLTFTP